MIGKKTSSKLIAEVIEEKLNNPDITLRELEEKTDLPKSTLSDIIKRDIGKARNSSETIAKLIDDNNQILNITGDKLLKSLVDENGNIKFEDFIKARDLALKQNTLVGLDNGKKELVVKFEI